jgi:hypothetical protein
MLWVIGGDKKAVFGGFGKGAPTLRNLSPRLVESRITTPADDHVGSIQMVDGIR